MDFLQIALIFLIGLLTIFLTVTGVQVFFILRDLRRMLLRFSGSEVKAEVIKKDIKQKTPKRKVFKFK